MSNIALIKISPKRLAVGGILFLFTAVASVFLYYGLAKNSTGVAHAISAFYGIAWLIAISLFGGIHGAPKWSFVPSIILASFAQNLLILFCVRALARLIVGAVGSDRED